ncbi:MAG TPA: hypothetical protein VLL76_01730 [Candidatus Omnitrophota bacterium]|nr:hypothetical protein [Candidatus Omnitrophota bacterium]
MDTLTPEKPAPDLWGDVFDFLATGVIFLGWLQIVVLVISALVTAAFMLSGKPMTLTVHGYWQVIPLILAFPFISVYAGRRLRKHARTSIPARVGIGGLGLIYVALMINQALQ